MEYTKRVFVRNVHTELLRSTRRLAMAENRPKMVLRSDAPQTAIS